MCLESLDLPLKIDILFVTFTFHFGAEFSSFNMASCPWKIGSIAMFRLFTSQSWRHNAGAREVPANHTLQCITMQVHESSQPIVRCDAYAVWQLKQYGGRRRSCREVASANKTSEKYTWSKAIHWKSHHQFGNEGLKNWVGKFLLEIVHPVS